MLIGFLGEFWGKRSELQFFLKKESWGVNSHLVLLLRMLK